MEKAMDGVTTEIERAKRNARRFAEMKRQAERDERSSRRVVSCVGNRVRGARPATSWVRG